MISLIHPDNKASIRVAEKAGMKLEKEVTIPNHGRR
jgi:RimJ/RimL family protein N-acetyltransferase